MHQEKRKVKVEWGGVEEYENGQFSWSLFTISTNDFLIFLQVVAIGDLTKQKMSPIH